MGNRVTEKTVTSGTLRWLRKQPESQWQKRLGGISNRGQPDITGCMFGFRVEIEMKTWGNTASDLQELRLSEWKEARAITGVSYCLEDTKRILCEGFREKITGMEQTVTIMKQFLKENDKNVKTSNN